MLHIIQSIFAFYEAKLAAHGGTHYSLKLLG